MIDASSGTAMTSTKPASTPITIPWPNRFRSGEFAVGVAYSGTGGVGLFGVSDMFRKTIPQRIAVRRHREFARFRDARSVTLETAAACDNFAPTELSEPHYV